jgi:hypothetical protein
MKYEPENSHRLLIITNSTIDAEYEYILVKDRFTMLRSITTAQLRSNLASLPESLKTDIF